MKELSWDLLRSFCAVMENHSLSGAARALGATQPTIGRHIELLETQLGLSLFLRSREGLRPTEEALDLWQYAEPMQGTFAAFMRHAAGEQDELTGVVRLTTSEIMGVEVLPPLLADFREKYPRVELELVISNRVQNLLKRQADIALRMTEPTQQAVVATKVGVSPIGFYAHQSYIDKYGRPKSLLELKEYTLIGPDEDRALIDTLIARQIVDDRQQIQVRTDNQLAQLALLRSGAGISGMQVSLAEKNPNLVRLIPDVIDMPIWLLMHEDMRASRKVRATFDFLRDRLREVFHG